MKVEAMRRKEMVGKTVARVNVSWLITKRNLSEHHGNALSNIVSP